MTTPPPGMRSAYVIELHNAGVILCESATSRMRAGWTEDEWAEAAYVIDGDELGRLAQHLGIQPQSIKSRDRRTNKPETLELEDFVLEMKKTRIVVSDELIELSARVQGPQLLHIQVKLEYTYKDEPKTEVVTREITYSGNYTVWWK